MTKSISLYVSDHETKTEATKIVDICDYMVVYQNQQCVQDFNQKKILRC